MASHSRPADTVFLGGSVMTMDPATPTAAAVAVAAGRIAAVGDDRSILELVGPRTRRVDLAGRTLLPGFIDAHCHPVLAGVELGRCALNDLPESRDAYLDAIRN